MKLLIGRGLSSKFHQSSTAASLLLTHEKAVQATGLTQNNMVVACSFCKKDHSEVRKLIAGSGVYICDSCNAVCSDIIAKELAADADAVKGDLRIDGLKAEAEAGNAKAQGELGSAYVNSEGVLKDMVEALKWFRKAAEQGDARGQNGIGNCYYYGEGVAKDAVEAVKWIRKATEQGFAAAQYNLGCCYYNGEGVPKDYVEAYAWLNLAAGNGNTEATKGRDELEKKYPQQIADGQKRSRELAALIEAKKAKH